MKRSCNSGERYRNSRGNIMPAKEIKKGCNQNCRYKCHSHFTQKDREGIFHSYWQLADVNRQREFLFNYSNPQKKKSIVQC